MLLTLLPLMASANDSGSCGTNVTYTYVESTHTLTISGNGAMDDFKSDNTPWNSYKSEMMRIVIEKGVTSIGGRAFPECSGLISVTIPNSVTSIGQYAFRECSGLTSVTIPNSVTSIRNCAFEYCIGLTSVTIPNSVTTIENSVFNGCSGLTSVTIPNSVTTIGDNAFANCYGLTSIAIPDGVTSIGSRAFYDCRGLTSVVLSNQLLMIRANAFYKCSKLKTLTIPATVEYIYQNAFAYCSSLTSINAQSSTPPFIYDNTFPNYNIPVNVPSGSREAYAAHDVWGKFTTINDGNVYYQLTVTADNHGTVTYNTTAVENTTKTFGVKEGTDATLTLTPNSGYLLATVTVNGMDRTAEVENGVLTISNVTANTVVVVTFSIAGETATVTIGSNGLATFSSTESVDFSQVEGLKAYTATGFNRETGVLTMTRVYDVPAETGLMVKGAAGTYEVPVKASASVYANLLQAVTTATTISATTAGCTNYLLGNGSHGLGFYAFNGSQQIAAGKAYLQIPTATANSRRAIVLNFDENETTGISSAAGSNRPSGQVYNLQGQRVSGTQRGLFIRDGKKFVVK